MKAKVQVVKAPTRTIGEAIRSLRDNFLEKGYYYILPEDKRSIPNYGDINNQFCYHFAEEIVEEFQEANYCQITLLGRPHAFIEYHGLYYDSECPEGVVNFLELNMFKDLKHEQQTKR